MCPETSQASPSLPPPPFLSWRTCSGVQLLPAVVPSKLRVLGQVWCVLQALGCPSALGKIPTSYTRIGIILEGCWAFSHSLILGVSSVCGWLLSHSAWWDQAGKTTRGPALCGKSLIPLFPEPPHHLWTSGHLQSGKPICPSEQRVGTCDPFVCAIKI